VFMKLNPPHDSNSTPLFTLVLVIKTFKFE
jgi:hypothetical protein